MIAKNKTKFNRNVGEQMNGVIATMTVSNVTLTICVIWLKHCIKDIAENYAKDSAAAPGNKLHFALFAVLAANISAFFYCFVELLGKVA